MIFVFNCGWLGEEDVTREAETAEQALEAFAAEHGVTLWGLDHYPAETPDESDEWTARFDGQTWGNGDFNIESVTVTEAQPEDVAAPC